MDAPDNNLFPNPKSDEEKTFNALLSSITSFEDCIIRLESALDGFPAALEEALKKNTFIEEDLAIELHRTCIALLSCVKSNRNAAWAPHVLAAIDYFIKTDDGDDDFKNIGGFDDDQRILETVINHFNLKELLTEGAA